MPNSDDCRFRSTALFALLLSIGSAAAGEVRIAVASNFLTVARQLAPAFETETGHTVEISSGSTGKLYAQIINGAPFDIFLAADATRPRLLQEQGRASQRLTYAVGQLVLWLPSVQANAPECRSRLIDARFRRLAIANPRTAPYGQAAQETMASLGVSIDQGNLVLGENISQTYAFAYSGNVDAALIAASQWRQQQHRATGCHWPVPEDLHQPLIQQAAVLAGASNKPAALEFMTFLTGPTSRELIIRSGYRLPD